MLTNRTFATALLTLLAVFAVAGGVFAQDDMGGLSDEDMALWASANATSTAFTSLAYTFTLDMNLDAGDGAPIAANLTGTGVIGDQGGVPVFTMDITGNIQDLGDVALNVIFVNDTAYVQGIDPSGGWLSISEADLDTAGAMLPIDPNALAQGDTSSLGLDETAQAEVFGDLASFDPTQYIMLSRGDDVDGAAAFIVEVLLEELAASELVTSAVAAGITTDNPELSFAEAEEQAAGTLAMAGMFLAGSEVSFTQFVDLETNTVEEAALVILTGEAAPLLVDFAFNVMIDEYNPAVSLEAPAESTPLSEMLGM